MSAGTVEALTSADVCEITGCTYRQLDYWCRQGFVAPSVTAASGQGSRRRWAPADVARVDRLRQASEVFRSRRNSAA